MGDCHAYFAHLRELLQLELREEQEAYRRSWQARAGFLSGSYSEPGCRYPIQIGSPRRNTLGRLEVEVRYEIGEDEQDTDFETNKPVSFFYIDAKGLQELPMQAYIEHIDIGRMRVSLPTPMAAQRLTDAAQRHLMGIQLSVDSTSFRVMTEALHQAERSERPSLCKLRDAVLGTRGPTFRSLPRLSYPWLNDSQQQAIQRSIEAQEVAIIHGPPGTGKTTTLVEAIIETLRREPQVLVCAPSNAAVDWISEQLMRRGVPVLRVGNPSRMNNEMLDCSYERRYAAHPSYHELWNIRRTLQEHVGPQKAEQLHRRETELEIQINNDLFSQARVVSSTLIGSAYRIMEQHRFGTLFIDEAAQALEPACWVAMIKADRLVMSGDHQQLPPTVKSIEAAKGGLADTMMQKMALRHPQCTTLLTIQYRMNQQIMDFSSRWFYHGQLKAAPAVAHQLISPIDTPLQWVDTSMLGFGERRSAQMSLSNSDEARLLIHTLKDYIETITPRKVEDEQITVGIITPYRKQARLLRRLLKMQHYFRQLHSHITVGTIDSFQGQERDVILISMVRDNADANSLGFLRDLRRMNVAMTRARMKLIIVGSTQTLGQHRFYRELAQYVEDHGDMQRLTPDGN